MHSADEHLNLNIIETFSNSLAENIKVYVLLLEMANS